MQRSTIILAVLALLILGAAAYLLFGRPDTSNGVTASGAPATAAEMTFVSLTAQLDPVAFDTAILQDPRFIMLQDIKTTIVPEPTGRIDPFAPLGR